MAVTSAWHRRQARLEAIAGQAERHRALLLSELQSVGRTRGHAQLCWCFPTLVARGGTRSSSMARAIHGGFLGDAGADLESAVEALHYLQCASLRSGLLDVLRAVEVAMAEHSSRAAYAVLDEGFGRSPEGEWLQGPADAFRLCCCATLFAAVAHRGEMPEVRDAALAVLRRFCDDDAVVYISGGPGTAGYAGDAATNEERRTVLCGLDGPTLGLVDSSAADAWADLEHLLDPTLASSSDVPPSSELGGGGAGVRLHARLTAEGTVDVVCICAPYERVLERVLGANE